MVQVLASLTLAHPLSRILQSQSHGIDRTRGPERAGRSSSITQHRRGAEGGLSPRSPKLFQAGPQLPGAALLSLEPHSSPLEPLSSPGGCGRWGGAPGRGALSLTVPVAHSPGLGSRVVESVDGQMSASTVWTSGPWVPQEPQLPWAQRMRLLLQSPALLSLPSARPWRGLVRRSCKLPTECVAARGRGWEQPRKQLRRDLEVGAGTRQPLHTSPGNC